MRLINSLKIAFSMYTRIPTLKADWTEQNMRYVMCCFPCVGLLIGAAVWAAGRLLDALPFGRAFDTAVLLLVPLFITGGIHMDGFLDTVDALSAYQPAERRLEILKDAHTGAFAVIGAAVYFLLDYAVWSEVTTETLPVLLPGFVLSRVLSAFSVTVWQGAKKDGLAAGFRQAAQKRFTAAALILEGAAAATAMFVICPRAAFLETAAAAGAFVYYRYMAYRKFGGVTGDLAGWFLQVCELAMAGSVVIGSALWS